MTDREKILHVAGLALSCSPDDEKAAFLARYLGLDAEGEVRVFGGTRAEGRHWRAYIGDTPRLYNDLSCDGILKPMPIGRLIEELKHDTSLGFVG